MSALVIVVLGIWMIVSPLAIGAPAFASWNSWVVGVICAICGTQIQRENKVWQAILTYIASACIFVAGFIPRLQGGDELIGRSIIFGALLFIAGVSSFGHHPTIEQHAAPPLR